MHQTARQSAIMSEIASTGSCTVADLARRLAVSGETIRRVFMAGGELQAALGAGPGPAAADFVSQFRVRTAFLSAGAIDAVDGLTDSEMAEAQFSRALIGAAERVIVVADHGKFGKRALVRACELDAIDMLITDAPPPPDLAGKLDEAGVVVEVAG